MTKLHEFKIDAYKLICRICKEQTEICFNHTKNSTGQIIGGVLSLHCDECYTRGEDILIITHLQPSEQSSVLTES